jgi:branched-chain amino acid aminotransferase
VIHAQSGCVSVNGRLCEPAEAAVSAFDAGFLLGDGLFESLRATDGVPYLLERHLRRLCAAAAALEFAHVPSPEALAEQVLRTVRRAALPHAYVRVTVTRGTGGVGLAPPAGAPTVVVAVLPAQPLAEAGSVIAATLLWCGREPQPGDARLGFELTGRPRPEDTHLSTSPWRAVAAKSTSWQPAVLARRRVEALGADEGLYVAADGHVLEGVSSNVFAVAGGRLLTPPASQCLPGVTRARVIELARDHGAPVLEAPLGLDALREAEEVFVTNAVLGLRAVASVSGAAVGVPRPDGLFETLHRLYALDRAGALEQVA